MNKRRCEIGTNKISNFKTHFKDILLEELRYK